jgi:hypothetical protein
MSDFFGDHDIPKGYGVCPSCNGQLLADVYECSTETGAPTEYGFYVHCKASHDAMFSAMCEADLTGNYNLVKAVEQCQWDYDDLLRASARAYKYLKNLKR